MLPKSTSVWLNRSTQEDFTKLLDVYIEVKERDSYYGSRVRSDSTDVTDTEVKSDSEFKDIGRQNRLLHVSDRQGVNETPLDPPVCLCEGTNDQFVAKSVISYDGICITEENSELELKTIARQLREISDKYALEKSKCFQECLDSNPNGLSSSEISILQEIISLYRPSVKDIANIVLKNVTPGVIGGVLDMLIASAENRESQIALSFDLIGTLYLIKSSIYVPGWVKRFSMQHLTTKLGRN